MKLFFGIALIICIPAFAGEGESASVSKKPDHQQKNDDTWKKVDKELEKGGKNIRKFLFSDKTNEEFEKRKLEQEAEERAQNKKKPQPSKDSEYKVVNEANEAWSKAVSGVNSILKTQRTDESGDKKEPEKSK